MIGQRNTESPSRAGQTAGAVSPGLSASRPHADAGAAVRSTAGPGAACLFTMFAVAVVFMNQAVFPELADSFGLAAQEARFSFSVVSLCYSLTFLFAGPVVDTFDCRKVAALGLGAIAVLLLCAAEMRGYPWFLACTGLMGVAAAVVPASMFPYVSRTAPRQKAGVHIGAVVASATLGIVVGRAALGVSAELAGWRDSYRFFALGFALLSLGALRLPAETAGDGRSAAGMRALFAEMLRMLVSPAAASLLLTGFFLFFGFLGAVAFLTYRLAAPPFSFSSAQVGWISFAGLAAIIAPFVGGPARRFGAYRIILPGMAVCLAALQLLWWSRGALSMTLGVLLLFLGAYACQPLLFLLMSRRIPQRAVGCASSLYILFCIGGGSVSSMVLGGVWEVYGWSGVIAACSASIVLALVTAAASAGGGGSRRL